MKTDANNRYTVLCDFDGTISRVDVTDSLLTAFASAGWREIEMQWLQGRISSRECMVRQVELVDADLSAINKHLSQIDIDPEFPDFAKECIGSGIQLIVVSDGIDYIIRKILGRYGLEHLPVLANKLVAGTSTGFSLEFPFSSPGCDQGTCKCMPGTDVSRDMRLIIGDGASDFCIARNADIVFAKDKLRDYCRKHRIPHIPFSKFSDIRAHFTRLFESTHTSQSPNCTEYLEIIADA